MLCLGIVVLVAIRVGAEKECNCMDCCCGGLWLLCDDVSNDIGPLCSGLGAMPLNEHDVYAGTGVALGAEWPMRMSAAASRIC